MMQNYEEKQSETTVFLNEVWRKPKCNDAKSVKPLFASFIIILRLYVTGHFYNHTNLKIGIANFLMPHSRFLTMAWVYDSIVRKSMSNDF